MPTPISTQLAEFILALYNTKQLVIDSFDQRIELIQLLKEQNISAIAYWLNFHSFIQAKLEKLYADNISQLANYQQIQTKAVEIIGEYLGETTKKSTIPKFTEDDFLLTQDKPFHQIVNTFKGIKCRSNPVDKRSLAGGDVKYFLLAKNRRSKLLGRRFSGVAIDSLPNEPEGLALEKLVIKILSLSPRDRKQIIYYHAGNDHAIAFDVQVASNGKIKIFCIDTAGHTFQLDALDKLYDSLQSRQINFEIKACREIMQADRYNCGFYVLAILNELSKYENVFDYLPSVIVEDTQSKNIKFAYYENYLSINIKYEFKNISNMTWVSLQNLPNKIIMFTHSYTNMEKMLTAKHFDLDVSQFIAMHKRKYDFDENHPKRKYIKKRREHIHHNVTSVAERISRQAYLTKIKAFPMLRETNIDYNKYLNQNNISLQTIAELFQFILQTHGISNRMNLSEMEKDISDNEMELLLQLRYEYITRLLRLDPPEIVKILNTFEMSNNIFCYELESCVGGRKKQFQQHLLSVKLDLLNFIDPKKYLYIVRKIETLIYEFLDPTIENPLLTISSGQILAHGAKNILNILNQTADKFRDYTGVSLLADKTQLDFIVQLFELCFYKSISKEIVTAYLLKLSSSKDIPEQEIFGYVIKLLDAIRLNNFEYASEAFLNILPAHQLIAIVLGLEGKEKTQYTALFPNKIKLIEQLLETNKDISTNIILQWVSACPTMLTKLEFIKQLYEYTCKNNGYDVQGYLSNAFAQFFHVASDKECFQDAVISILMNSRDIKRVTLYEKWLQKLGSQNQPQIYYFFNSKKIFNYLTILQQKKCLPTGLSSYLPYFMSNIFTTDISPAEYWRISSHSKPIYNKKLKLIMSSYSTDEIFTKETKWHCYCDVGTRIDDNIDEWKLNVSIHPDDLDKAVEIISDIASRHSLKAYKVMDLEQAKSPTPTMVGREIVIYTRYNPELKPDDWLEILCEMEKTLSHHGIKPSSTNSPITNRSINRYVSYTHTAWTRYSMDTPFDVGLKLHDLQDKDIFKTQSNIATDLRK